MRPRGHILVKINNVLKAKTRGYRERPGRFNLTKKTKTTKSTKPDISPQLEKFLRENPGAPINEPTPKKQKK